MEREEAQHLRPARPKPGQSAPWGRLMLDVVDFTRIPRRHACCYARDGLLPGDVSKTAIGEPWHWATD